MIHVPLSGRHSVSLVHSSHEVLYVYIQQDASGSQLNPRSIITFVSPKGSSSFTDQLFRKYLLIRRRMSLSYHLN